MMDKISQLLQEGNLAAVLFLVLIIGIMGMVAAVGVMWRRQIKLYQKLDESNTKYTKLLVEVTSVLERIPAQIDSTWKQAVADLKLHIIQLLKP